MEPNPTPTPKPTRKVGATPERDQARAAVWQAMAAAWKTNPQITLAYTTQAEFETAAKGYADKLKTRLDADDPRPLLSNRLDVIQDVFNDALPYIKGDLLKIYKKEGVEAAYPSYGIARRDDVWQFPKERLTAQAQYDKLVAALAAQGLTAGDYGSATLAPLAAEFQAKYQQLVKLDQDTSDAVGAKNLGKPYLKKVARSLRLVLEGNYPETYEQVLRAWGVQKEKFGEG